MCFFRSLADFWCRSFVRSVAFAALARRRNRACAASWRPAAFGPPAGVSERSEAFVRVGLVIDTPAAGVGVAN